MRDREFAQQLLGGGDLVGFLVDIDMPQDQASLGIECVQQLSSLAAPEMVETAPERLAIQRDNALRKVNRTVQKTHRMPAESLFDGLRVQALQDGANGGMGGCALPAQTEGGVQPVEVDRHEGFDRAVGVAAGNHAKDRKQQNLGQLIELTFGPARIRDLAEQGDQRVERSQGSLLAVEWPHYRTRTTGIIMAYSVDIRGQDQS